jgi:hypothetical protein
MQAPIVLDAYNRPGTPIPEHLSHLQEHLLSFYPADHQAVLLISATHPLLDPIRLGVSLGDLASALARGSTVATLYIPPVNSREIADEQLAELMKVPESGARVEPETVPRRPGRPTIGPQH